MVLIMIRFIEIKDEHIREGMPEDSECCAVALALSEEYKTKNVSVDATQLMVHGISLKISRDQISFLHNWINEFDKCSWDENGNIDEDYAPEPFTLKVIEEIYENKNNK